MPAKDFIIQISNNVLELASVHAIIKNIQKPCLATVKVEYPNYDQWLPALCALAVSSPGRSPAP